MLRFSIRFLASVVSLALLLDSAEARESHYFALEGPGTASVMISYDRSTAFITDGGHRGRRGLGGASLDGETLIDALESRGVRHLVITCSHPHADHMGGLVDLLRNPIELSRRFESLVLIDSAYGKNSLKQIYDAAAREARDADPKLALIEAEYRPAAGRNAFAGLSVPTDDVFVRNYRYQAREGATAHGHSVITMYTLREGNAATSVADFDDANSELVEKWVKEGNRADILILPHHGSDAEKLDGLLKVGAQACVVTVDPHNRYRHPGPQNLARLLRHFGRENVHFTGSTENVRIDATGVTAADKDYQQAFEDFVRPQQRHLERRIRTLEEKLILQYSEVENLSEGGERKNVVAKIRRTKRSLSQARAAFESTIEVEGQLTGKKSQAPWWDPDLPSDFLTARRGRPQGPRPGSGSGGVPLVPLPDHTGIWKARVEPEIARRMGGKMWTPRSEFRANFKGLPSVGGVIIGNSLDSKGLQLSGAAWVECPSSEECDDMPLRLRLETNRGIVWYEQATATEAALAHRFADANQVALVSGGFDDSGNHVFGVNPTLQNTLVAYDAMRLDSFFAGADSTLKLSNDHTFRMPKWRMLVWHDRPSHLTLQGDWLDVRSEAETSDALIVVRFVDVDYPAWYSREDREGITKELRRRLRNDPEWLAVRREIDSEVGQLKKEIDNLKERLQRSRSQYEAHQSSRFRINGSRRIDREIPKSLEDILGSRMEDHVPKIDLSEFLEDSPLFDALIYEQLEERLEGLIERYNARVPIWNRRSQRVSESVQARLKQDMQAELEGLERDPSKVFERSESQVFNHHIELVQAQSASYRRINAFARTVLILNWVRDSLGSLPELPASIAPIQLNVPHDASQKQLLSPQIKAMREGVEQEESAVAEEPAGDRADQEAAARTRLWLALTAGILGLTALGLYLGRR